ALVDAELHESIADRADLGEEVLVRNRDLAVLVAALLLVRNLVLDLDAARARLDELPGEQIGRLGVAEAGVDVGDDRDDVSLVVVDRMIEALGLHLVARLARLVECAEHAAELAGVGLPQERVEL